MTAVPGPPEAAEVGREPLDIDALMHEHWLTFGQVDGRAWPVVIGCHCGFPADVDSDCGYGDSVVRHLFEVSQ